MGQQHHKIRAGSARCVDIFLQHFLANAEGERGKQPPRIGDRKIGKSLSYYGDVYAAPFIEFGVFIGRLVPFLVENIGAQQREGQTIDNLLDPLLAIGEFPMGGHRVRLQDIHDVHHVLARSPVGDIRPLPGVATIEQQHVGLARRADGVNHRCHLVKPTHAAIGSGECGKILGGQRIGGRAACVHTKTFQKIGTGDMGRQAGDIADANIGGGFAEEDRHGLGVNIGDVQG